MQKIIFNSNNKKMKLQDTIKESKIKISNKILILSLIDSGNLDNIINKIDEDSIEVIKSPLVQKGYLTGYEQFISILDKFISYTIDIIDSPELIETIITNCIVSNSDILLSKKYLYDSDNIEYYKSNFNFIIGYIFFKNILIMKNDLYDELVRIKLNIKENDITDKNSMENIVNVLSEIIFINRNDYKILSLFANIEEHKYDMYLSWYKMLIFKYIKNINFINAYREFKNNN